MTTSRRLWTTAGRLLSATVLAQAAVLAATIATATRLSPRDFAWFGAATGLAAVVNTVSTLGVEGVVAVADRAMMSSLLRVGTFSVLLVTLSGLFASAVLFTLGHPVPASVVGVATLAAACTAWQGIAIALAMRESMHGALARSRIVQGLINATLIVGLSALPIRGDIALGAAWIVAVMCSLAALGPAVRVHMSSATLRSFGRDDVAVARQALRSQPLGNFLGGVTVQLPLLLLPSVAGPGIAGAWALFSRILGSVVVASHSSIQPVYYAETARRARARQYSALAEWNARWVLWLTAAAVPGFAVAGLVVFHGAAWIGPQWTAARDIVFPACLFWCCTFVGLPVVQTLVAVGRFRAQLNWTVARAVVAAAAFAFWPVWGALGSVWAWSITCALSYVVLVVLQRVVLTTLRAEQHEVVAEHFVDRGTGRC